MSVDYVPFKLLEINVVSAQDLPAVSKMLRTFVVAWIQPDHKLSTRIDHQGHTNPTWNYKLVFRVDDKFLRSESSAITFEIYNVAWLRDLPIGTACFFINHLSPPLTSNNPTTRSVAIHIRRPSGHLQGILHLGINLTDNNISSSPLRSSVSAFILENQDITRADYQNVQEPNLVENNEQKDERKIEKKDSQFQELHSKNKNAMLQNNDVLSMQDSDESENQPESKVKPRIITSTNISTINSVMFPLPSEVAVNLKKGFYSTEVDEFGSSIFENWSEASDNSGDRLRSNVKWQMDDQIPLTKDYDGDKAKDHEGHKIKDHEGHKTKDQEGLKTKDQEVLKAVRLKRRRHSDGGGLFSCFMKGLKFTFVCGSNNMKKNRKKIHHHLKFHVIHKDEKIHHLQKFHVSHIDEKIHHHHKFHVSHDDEKIHHHQKFHVEKMRRFHI